MGFFKKAAVATAMATAVVSLVGQNGAFADTVSDAVVAVGTGTITPGLPTSGCAVQTDITFTGNGAVVGDDGVTAPASVTFDGNSGSTCESLNSGQGSGTLGGTFSANVTYQRTGPIVQVFGSGNIGGKPHSPIAAVCIFIPTSVNPVTSYALACAAALSSTGD
jgi:hypothetical protein